MVFVGCIGHAQNFAEWFSQKKTQLKYLADQIAAFQVYTGYLRKGYHIASEGLGTINNIKSIEFNLHNIFFRSLKTINPIIAKDGRIAAVVAMQVSIVQCYHKLVSGAPSYGRLSVSQMNYIYAVFSNLLDECTQDLSELIMLTSSGQYELSDAERIERIDRVYNSMLDKYVFTQSFATDVKIMGAAATKAHSDDNVLQKIYNLK